MGIPGKATVTKEGYKDYIQSQTWQEVRKRFLASKVGKMCYMCSAPYKVGFHIHHATYKNLGNERIMDLRLVCPDCHSAIHDLAKSEKLNIWSATKKARRKLRKSLT